MQKSIIIFSAAICLLGLLSYGNSLNGKFLWDDNIIIKDNPHVKSFAHTFKIFTGDFGSGSGKKYYFYRPLQIFTHLLEYSMWGPDVRDII